MKKFIQIAIIASTGLMFIQTSANAQAWKHCAQNIADKYHQCLSQNGGNRCGNIANRGLHNCYVQAKANNTGRYQEQLPSWKEFQNWYASRYLGKAEEGGLR